jgi:hypothetical protein
MVPRPSPVRKAPTTSAADIVRERDLLPFGQGGAGAGEEVAQDIEHDDVGVIQRGGSARDTVANRDRVSWGFDRALDPRRYGADCNDCDGGAVDRHYGSEAGRVFGVRKNECHGVLPLSA